MLSCVILKLNTVKLICRVLFFKNNNLQFLTWKQIIWLFGDGC